MEHEVRVPPRQVRATFSDATIVVYQAYPSEIAAPAVRAGTFVAPFKRDRMTWIKPSFLWMMYRSGWATKPGQERVLAVSITREGFEWSLTHSCLTHYDPEFYAGVRAWKDQKESNPVRVQWDPERSLTMDVLDHRTIQIGLGGAAVQRYLDEWITEITDVTALAHEVHRRIESGDFDQAREKLPSEEIYDLSPDLRRVIGAT